MKDNLPKKCDNWSKIRLEGICAIEEKDNPEHCPCLACDGHNDTCEEYKSGWTFSYETKLDIFCLTVAYLANAFGCFLIYKEVAGY